MHLKNNIDKISGIPVEYMKRLSNLSMKHLPSWRAIESKYICLITRVLRVVALPLQQNEWFFMTATIYRFQIVKKKNSGEPTFVRGD